VLDAMPQAGCLISSNYQRFGLSGFKLLSISKPQYQKPCIPGVGMNCVGLAGDTAN